MFYGRGLTKTQRCVNGVETIQEIPKPKRQGKEIVQATMPKR